MAVPDFYTNRFGEVLVIAPAPEGRLSKIVEEKFVVFNQSNGEMSKGLTRWIYANIPEGSLKDQWGNTYNHQVHSLVVGTLEEGNHLLSILTDHGFHFRQADEMFVPFQTLKIHDRKSSDSLRASHPRAFALARRNKPQPKELVTALRDSIMIGID
jgi:hypothetical protein